MHFYQDERVALFIDGSNLYATAKTLGFDIDYKRLLGYFRKRARLIRAIYYTALLDDAEYSPIKPLIDWLDYNGYRVVTKPAKEYTDAMGRRKVKGNMDIELAIDVMQLGRSARSHRAVLGRRRFPLAGCRRSGQGAPRHRDFDADDTAADDRRRTAPADRPVHRRCRSAR
jgi:uncharacterized LabA/DUF88 family protein